MPIALRSGTQTKHKTLPVTTRSRKGLSEKYVERKVFSALPTGEGADCWSIYVFAGRLQCDN